MPLVERASRELGGRSETDYSIASKAWLRGEGQGGRFDKERLSELI